MVTSRRAQKVPTLELRPATDMYTRRSLGAAGARRDFRPPARLLAAPAGAAYGRPTSLPDRPQSYTRPE